MLPTQIAAAIENVAARATISHMAAAPKLRRGSTTASIARSLSRRAGWAIQVITTGD
jgi:hypothetical protein